MKLSKFSTSVIALAMSAAFSAQAADDRYIVQVENKGKGIVKALAKQVGGTIKLDANGFFAVEFAGKNLDQVKGLLNNPHVKLVEEDQRRKPMGIYNDTSGDPMTEQVTPYAVYQSQADQLTYQGGKKVCVIDSGLNANNTDFDWNLISGDNDPGTGNWNETTNPHGTHVAGTIAAADNDKGVIGMAPGVALHIIKVFNPNWAYSSDLAHATQLCGDAGADIINMSLGGGGASTVESQAFELFTSNGGLVIASAGNDGNNVRSYPAGYPSVMMIAANDADNNIANFSQFPDCGKGQSADDGKCVEVSAGGVATLSTMPAGEATTASLSADGIAYSASAMEVAGSASGNTYHMGIGDAIDSAANGQICVIDRGTISFHDKVKNCQDSGGIGTIVINNVAGMLYGTLGDASDLTIPAIGAALEDRDALVNSATASIAIEGSDYGYMNGTSMSAPAVSGLAALVWSNYPECSGTAIRDVFKATAEDAGDPGKDVHFGYGIVKAKAAADYLAANGCPEEAVTEFTLSVSSHKKKGAKYADLSWAGSTTDIMWIYRDGQKIDAVNNVGSYSDAVYGKGKKTFTYKVCEYDTGNCSNEQTISF